MRIILRTLCGCERSINWNKHIPPPEIHIPLMATVWMAFPKDEFASTPLRRRIFRRELSNEYGEPIYLEREEV